MSDNIQNINENTTLTLGGLIEILDKHNLIVAPKDLIQERVNLSKILRKKALTVQELHKSKIFPNVKTYQTFKNWCHNGKLKEDVDWFRGKDNRIRILTSSIKVLANIE